MQNIAIVGPGSIGKLLAYTLAGCYNVTLIGRPGKTSDRIRKSGRIAFESRYMRELTARYPNLTDEDCRRFQIRDEQGVALKYLIPSLYHQGYVCRQPSASIGTGFLNVEQIIDYTQSKCVAPIIDSADQRSQNRYHEIVYVEDPLIAGPHDSIIVTSPAHTLTERFAEEIIAPLRKPGNQTKVYVLVNGIVPWLLKDEAYIERYYFGVSESGSSSSYVPRSQALVRHKPLDRALHTLTSIQDARLFYEKLGPQQVVGGVLNVAVTLKDKFECTAALHNQSMQETIILSKGEGVGNPFDVYRMIGNRRMEEFYFYDDYFEHAELKIAKNLMNIVCAATNRGKQEILEKPRFHNLYKSCVLEYRQITEALRMKTISRKTLKDQSEFVQEALDFHMSSINGEAHVPSTLRDFRAGKTDTERKFLIDSIIEMSEMIEFTAVNLVAVQLMLNKAEEAVSNGTYCEFAMPPNEISWYLDCAQTQIENRVWHKIK